VTLREASAHCRYFSVEGLFWDVGFRLKDSALNKCGTLRWSGLRNTRSRNFGGFGLGFIVQGLGFGF